MNKNLKALLQIKTIESYQKMQSWVLIFASYLLSLKPARVRYPFGSWQRNLLVRAGDIVHRNPVTDRHFSPTFFPDVTTFIKISFCNHNTL